MWTPTDSGASDRSEISLMRSVLIALMFLISLPMPRWTEAAGPWQAQVVSADSKQPLEGVVVLAWWTRNVRSFGGPSEDYRDAQEVLTDNDGRFTIESRWFFSLNPLVFFRGPFIAMFRSGYGDYGWPGYAGSETWPEEKRKALQTEAQLLQLEGIVLEVPALPNTEQRVKYLEDLSGRISGVPHDRRPLMQEAIMEERKALESRGRIRR
jgi:hypothetical protein